MGKGLPSRADRRSGVKPDLVVGGGRLEKMRKSLYCFLHVCNHQVLSRSQLLSLKPQSGRVTGSVGFRSFWGARLSGRCVI